MYICKKGSRYTVTNCLTKKNENKKLKNKYQRLMKYHLFKNIIPVQQLSNQPTTGAAEQPAKKTCQF